VHGASLGLRTTDPDLLGEVCARLPPGWTPAKGHLVDRLVSVVAASGAQRPGLRRLHVAYVDSRLVLRTPSLEDLLFDLRSELEQTMIESAQERLFVHAGAVGWRGRAILIPGSSHSGKTSLVAALLRAGATYFSDEYAVLDAQGRVHAYPRPLLLRREGQLDERISPEQLGARVARRPLRVGMVLAAHHRARAAWRPIRLTPGRAMLALLRHTPAARAWPKVALSYLETIARQATVLEGARGEAEQVLSWLLDRDADAWRLETTA
jgi:hypothetical protein